MNSLQSKDRSDMQGIEANCRNICTLTTYLWAITTNKPILIDTLQWWLRCALRFPYLFTENALAASPLNWLYATARQFTIEKSFRPYSMIQLIRMEKPLTVPYWSWSMIPVQLFSLDTHFKENLSHLNLNRRLLRLWMMIFGLKNMALNRCSAMKIQCFWIWPSTIICGSIEAV